MLVYFLGSGPLTNIDFDGGVFSDTSLTPTDATCSYQVNSDGDEYGHVTNVFQSIGTWLIAGNASDWEVKMDMDSGTNFTGAGLGAWLNCGTTRTWSLTDSSQAGGPVTGTATLSIGLAGKNTALTSVSVTLTAEESA